MIALAPGVAFEEGDDGVHLVRQMGIIGEDDILDGPHLVHGPAENIGQGVFARSGRCRDTPSLSLRISR